MTKQHREKSIQTAIRRLKRVDPILGKVIGKASEYQVYRKRSYFESLARIIVGQQLSTKAAATIYGRLRTLKTKRGLTAECIASLSDEQLQSVGISRPKTRALRSLVGAVNDGSLNLRRLPYRSDDEVFDELTQVKGIGPWTAQIFLMFILGRQDVFPAGDLGIVNAMKLLYDGHDGEVDMESISEKWRPYRTLACWYLWRYLDSSR